MRIPGYRHHKPSGQAFIEWRGKRYYLGKHGSLASKDAYKRFLQQHVLPHHPVPPEIKPGRLSIATLCVHFLEWAKPNVRANEYWAYTTGCNTLVKLHGLTMADKFGPVKLNEVRDAWIAEKKWTRKYINRQLRRLRNLFRWAAEREYISADVLAKLDTVQPLLKGKVDVPEPDPISPAPIRDVVKTMKHLHATIETMVRVELRTGMRPGEVCAMKEADIDRTKHVWFYTPPLHKTSYLDKDRPIAIGPRVQRLLAPYLATANGGYIFSPQRTVEQLNEARRARRKTPTTPSQEARQRKRKPIRTPRDHYSTDTYRKAVVRAQKKAGVPSWSPNQLRHNYATAVKQRYGIEAVATLLGHARTDTSEIYAERDLGLAARIAAEIG